LPATGTTPIPGYVGLSSGADLSGLSATTIRLRARLATTDSGQTPTLAGWSVGWEAVPASFVEGGWSNVEHSTQQDLTPPQVTGVLLSGSEWSATYRAAVGGVLGGYAIPAGADQTTTLPWTGLDQVSVQFSENVHVTASDLHLNWVRPGTTYSVTGMTYDSVHHVATWTLDKPLGADRFTTVLYGTSGAPITDIAGNALDGEWTSSTSVFPSGNSVAGGDFRFRFDVVPGDIDATGTTDYTDYSALEGYLGWDSTQDPYFFRFDMDGSGLLDETDLTLLGIHYLDTVDDLPQPAAPAGGSGSGSFASLGTVASAASVPAASTETSSPVRSLWDNSLLDISLEMTLAKSVKTSVG
jgi:hypothetical protein